MQQLFKHTSRFIVSGDKGITNIFILQQKFDFFSKFFRILAFLIVFKNF